MLTYLNVQTMFPRATIKPQCKSKFLQQYILCLFTTKKESKLAVHISWTINWEPLFYFQTFVFALVITCLKGKFWLNLRSWFLKIFNFQYSKNKRGECIPNFLKVKCHFWEQQIKTFECCQFQVRLQFNKNCQRKISK